MNIINFSCRVSNSNSDTPLNLEILLNGQRIFQNSITCEEQVSFDINDDEQDQHLKFIVSGKNDSHTVLDENGSVQSSTELTIDNFAFDEINIDRVIAVNPLDYTHNFNGHGETVTDKFYNVAGCNGEIDFYFSTPIYMWLLEHM